LPGERSGAAGGVGATVAGAARTSIVPIWMRGGGAASATGVAADGPGGRRQDAGPAEGIDSAALVAVIGVAAGFGAGANGGARDAAESAGACAASAGDSRAIAGVAVNATGAPHCGADPGSEESSASIGTTRAKSASCSGGTIDAAAAGSLAVGATGSGKLETVASGVGTASAGAGGGGMPSAAVAGGGSMPGASAVAGGGGRAHPGSAALIRPAGARRSAGLVVSETVCAVLAPRAGGRASPGAGPGAGNRTGSPGTSGAAMRCK
jgi:hypothetical protein